MLEAKERLLRLEEGIQKAKLILDGSLANQLFTSEEYMGYYNIVYDLCAFQTPSYYSQKLYDRFKAAMEESISSRVLPALTGKTGRLLFVELLCMWTKYKAMANCLGGFFLYLERKVAELRMPGTLSDVSLCCFRDMVCKDNLKILVDTAVFLITEDRKGQPVDWDLANSISYFFLEIGGKRETFYYEMLENSLIAETACHYSQLASQWLLHYSSTDYMLKVDESLNLERARASKLLYGPLVDKLLYGPLVEKLVKVVHTTLISEPRSKLIEKQKAEKHVSTTTYQDLLGKCANLSIG